MKNNPTEYISGGAKGICQRCGFVRRVTTQLSREWTGLIVCRECFDPRPPELVAPVIFAEGLPVPNPSPEPPDAFVNDGHELREDGGDELREDGSSELRE